MSAQERSAETDVLNIRLTSHSLCTFTHVDLVKEKARVKAREEALATSISDVKDLEAKIGSAA